MKIKLLISGIVYHYLNLHYNISLLLSSHRLNVMRCLRFVWFPRFDSLSLSHYVVELTIIHISMKVWLPSMTNVFLGRRRLTSQIWINIIFICKIVLLRCYVNVVVIQSIIEVFVAIYVNTWAFIGTCWWRRIRLPTNKTYLY